MRSSLWATRPRLRRAVPWALWGLAALVATPLVMAEAGIGSSPAEIQANVAMLAPIRTAHRLWVSKILVTPGQRVKAGQLLVEMDHTMIDADLAVAEAKLAYVEILAGWQQLRMIDARARTTHVLASGAESSALDVARIVAEAERDRSELSQLDVNMEAEQRLVTDQLAGSERLKAMRLQRAALAKKVEEYKLAVAAARRKVGGATARLSSWSKGAEDPKSAAPSPTDLRRRAVALQQQEIDRLQIERSHYVVRAPFDGCVGQVLTEVGMMSADPSLPLVTVVKDRSKVAIAYLSQSDAKRILVGDRVRLIARDAGTAPITGHVTALAPNVAELPVRFRHFPHLPEFGRNAYIELDAPADLPGQAFDAVFRRAGGGGT